MRRFGFGSVLRQRKGNINRKLTFVRARTRFVYGVCSENESEPT